MRCRQAHLLPGDATDYTRAAWEGKALASAAYQRDLNMVPHRLRRPLEDYIHFGILPERYPELMALLAGDLNGAMLLHGNGGKPFIGAAVFVEEHCPDIARGHMAYVVRWQRWGGMQGRFGSK